MFLSNTRSPKTSLAVPVTESDAIVLVVILLAVLDFCAFVPTVIVAIKVTSADVPNRVTSVIVRVCVPVPVTVVVPAFVDDISKIVPLALLPLPVAVTVSV